ncbi:hypothetical protein ACFW1M_16520 [Streptomyces inhibens]|uniref:hypothetical protein n=1 Tax=Streptomyces inhibens TaxID=2293571 RepID=UPI0036A2E602
MRDWQHLGFVVAQRQVIDVATDRGDPAVSVGAGTPQLSLPAAASAEYGVRRLLITTSGSSRSSAKLRADVADDVEQVLPASMGVGPALGALT